MQDKTPYSFLNLEVYQDLFELGVIIHKEVVPKLPPEEKFGLTDQMSRSSKSAPTQIAEGYAKKHQRANWQNISTTAWANAMKWLFIFRSF